MIQNIKLKTKDIDCFKKEQKMDPLEKINFLYGENASGKTTITRILAQPETYSGCTIEWSNNNKKEVLVYNCDFIKENFHQETELKGIFTLGKDKIETQKRINNIENKSAALSNDIEKLQEELNKKKDKLNKLDNVFTEQCWESKKKEIEHNGLKDILKGVNADKSKLKEKFVELAPEVVQQEEQIKLEDLKKEYEILFSSKENNKELYSIDF